MQLKGSQVEGPVKDLETSERRCQAEEMPKGLIRWAAASRGMCGVLFVGTMDPRGPRSAPGFSSSKVIGSSRDDDDVKGAIAGS